MNSVAPAPSAPPTPSPDPAGRPWGNSASPRPEQTATHQPAPQHRRSATMAANDPVRLAIVGCGAITRSAHLPAALRSALVHIHALVDTSVANARELQKEYALKCAVVTDLEKVIGEVEGVLIATPNHTHLAVAS